jgi:phosphoglycerate kinase
LKTVVDLKLNNKKVILRCDLNVPMENNQITDETRIRESIETIELISNAYGKVIILSHLGRIKEENDKLKNSLQPVCQRLSELMKRSIKFIPMTRGPEVEQAVNEMEKGDIIMLENTRFEDLDGNKESSNNPELAKYWASLGDVFINDAFGTLHRAHASNVGIAEHLPSGIGLLVKKELDVLVDVMEKPQRPLLVILGGAKVSTKLGVIENLAKKADKIFIGGGMCYTFFKALGYNVGASIVDDEKVAECKRIYDLYKDKIILPTDVIVGTSYSPMSAARLTKISDIYTNDIGMDMGVETIDNLRKEILEAKTVIWNGPIGVFELDRFSNGTKKALEYLSNISGKVILGGGDTAYAAVKFGFKDSFHHISTGGGATLEFLEGKRLPGLDALLDE